AQARLPPPNALRFQHGSEMDLLGHHRLRLHYRAHAPAYRQGLDVGARFVSVSRPKDVPATRDYLFFKLKQVPVQVIDGLALDLLAAPARGLPVLESPTPAQVRGIIAFHVLADDFTMNQVSRLGRRVAQELLGSRAHKGILKFEILNLKYLNSFRSKSASIKSVFINLLFVLLSARSRVVTRDHPKPRTRFQPPTPKLAEARR